MTGSSYEKMNPIGAVKSSKPDDAPSCIQEDKTECQEGCNELNKYQSMNTNNLFSLSVTFWCDKVKGCDIHQRKI